MLRLLHLTICEKFIISMDGGTISLIEMFENVEVALPPNAAEKFLFPMKWSAIGLWRRETEFATPVNFVQLIIVKAANDDVFKVESLFVVSNDNFNYRNIVNFIGFPVPITNIVEIEIYLKQEGEDEWKKHFSYPINVFRIMQEKADDDKTATKNTSEADNKQSVQRVSSVSGTSKKNRVRSKKRHSKKH